MEGIPLYIGWREVLTNEHTQPNFSVYIAIASCA